MIPKNAFLLSDENGAPLDLALAIDGMKSASAPVGDARAEELCKAAKAAHLSNSEPAFHPASETFLTPLIAASKSSGRSSAHAAASPFARFEALVLQTFIQSMLPKESENVYGKGLSGEMWQSMMAQQIADVVTQRGGIGIADRLSADFRQTGLARS